MIMAEGTINDDGSNGLIIDELLCFVTNKIDNLDVDTLVRLCVETYTEKEIKCSKELLFDKLKCKDDLTEFKKRRSSKVSESKEVKNIRDIYQLLQEKGSTKWPHFVASDLSKLPPITYDHIDVTALLNQLQNVRKDVDMLKEGLGIQCKIGDSLKEFSACLDGRVAELEKKTEGEIDIESEDENSEIIEMFCCTECDFKFMTEAGLEKHL